MLSALYIFGKYFSVVYRLFLQHVYTLVFVDKAVLYC